MGCAQPERGRAKSGGRGELELTLGLPTYIGEDVDAPRAAARANLGLFTTLPFFQRLLHAGGFVREADHAEQGAGSDALGALRDLPDRSGRPGPRPPYRIPCRRA